MKAIISLFLAILSFFPSSAQDTSQYIGLTLKRSIWFYPNSITKTNRYNVKAPDHVSYLPLKDRMHLPAVHGIKRGFVESLQVSDDFQNYGQSGKVDLNITQAGARIKSGANSVIAGTLITVAGIAAGSLLIKDDQGLQDAIIYGSGGLGFLLMISGYGSIARGGRHLQEYRPE